MSSQRKPPAFRLLAVSAMVLALGAASAGAAAGTRAVAMHGPNGDGGSDCGAADPATPATAPAATAATASDSKASKPPAKAPATRIKPFVPVRGGEDTGTQAPRWHSFLPGMFR
ncbi:MAG TPA: hypothetical protein VK000_08550 [Luteimonas sp.]|nr:hypothetical protein [Luteimonas sp.]